MKKSSFFNGRIFVVILIIFTVASMGIFVGRWTASGIAAEADAYDELKTFSEALSIVRKNYVEDVKMRELVYGAVKGLLGSLDPHSAFMTPEQYREMQVDTKGEFGGIGIQIGLKDNILTVIAPIEDTPADKAGIKAGDKIIKINNDFTKDMGLQDAVSKMRGAPSSTVKITVLREGWKETKDFTITREQIHVKSVKSKVLEDGIGYIKINQFMEQTASDVSAAVRNMGKQKISSLILDLRNNPGGLLNSAVDVSGEFLPKDKLVVYIKDRKGERVEYKTGKNGDGHATPMVVLVNQGSASASEIVAGALKDWNRAVVVGTETFGKGSVQSVIPLNDGSALRLTTAIYYTPKGVSIQSKGITPDILVKPEVKDGDRTRPAIREKDLDRHLRNGEEIEEQESDANEMEDVVPLEFDEENDIQLERAIDILKTWKVLKEFPKAA
jgi:carboxyl-terminal processing protease